ncbi:FAD-dependent oxidoreductase [Rathayibacter sp. CAU 1779]
MYQQTVEHDITIIGGGLAGVSAAISAARLGKSVALVGNRPVLGGNSSSEVRVWVVGATAHGVQRFARETGVIGELYVENQYRNPDGNPIHWDEVVLDAVRAEPNIRLFLNTDVRDIVMGEADGQPVVLSARGWTMGSEIETTFRSPLFFDCTGDGLIGHLAGAEYRLGREARDEYGEEWAPETADREFLGSTLLFYTKDAGHPVEFVPPESTKDITQTPIPVSRVIRSGDTGAHYWWIEWGGELDIVHDNERIRDELRSVIFGVWDYIKNSGEFDADTLDLEWVGSMPGKREYRRFLGDHVLTQNDILDQTEFPDAVGFGGWSIDLHPVEGMYAKEAGAHQRYSDGIYGIPFRSYYSRTVANLMFAGRDISASHVAFGSSRVMATCAVGGEAIGTAGALALDLGVSPRELARSHAEELRQLLLKQDASVFGVQNSDPLDKARAATVTASSTLRDVDPAAAEPDGETTTIPLDVDLALVVPADPVIETVQVLVSAPLDVTLRAGLWTTGKPQNWVPVVLERELTVQLAGADAPQWVRIPVEWRPACPGNLVLVLGAADGVELHAQLTQVPGVLALPHRPGADGDANVAVEHAEPVVAWPARPLRGTSARVRLSPPTEAFAPEKAVGGYQRPYGGPQLWVSQPADFSEPEWLRLDWDEAQRIETIDLVFDDDVDVELNTLHHHRTPDRIFPELARDYAIDVLDGGNWREVVTVRDNRRRHRRHGIGPVSTRALRVRILATNGAHQARVVSLRCY